ncbi:MAG: VOC family protein [Myxococcales bacterium]|nr:VOC family protein [Myxococcales bacterium]
MAHIGIRVHDVERSIAFYAVLGFRKTAGPLGDDRVTILESDTGVEINLIPNAPAVSEPNVLMDVPVKHAGITHVALLVDDLEAARATVEAAGIALSGGPVQFTPTSRAFFVRDPDRTVIEIHESIAR